MLFVGGEAPWPAGLFWTKHMGAGRTYEQLPCPLDRQQVSMSMSMSMYRAYGCTWRAWRAFSLSARTKKELTLP